MSEDGLPPLREVIARHGLTARKGLGQNFLFDLNLTRRIARAAAPLQGFTVIEVGPGPGGLTRALLSEGARRVVAIEKDARSLPALDEIAAAWPGKLDIVSADALAFDWSRFAGQNSKIVANLPYNVATALLVKWLSLAWAALLFIAYPHVPEGSRRTDHCRSGIQGIWPARVIAQWRCEVKKLFDVDRLPSRRRPMSRRHSCSSSRARGPSLLAGLMFSNE